MKKKTKSDWQQRLIRGAISSVWVWSVGWPCGRVRGESEPAPLQTIQFCAADFSVQEGAREAIVTVTRMGPGVDFATVDHAAAAGTKGRNAATAGVDFQAISGTLKFASGDTNETFRVQILDDGLVEGAKVVLLNLSHPSDGASLGAQSHSMLTIEDNEVPTLFDPGFQPVLSPIADYVPSLLVQPDGKIVICCSFSVEGVAGHGLARLNLDGSLDPSFAGTITDRPPTSAFGWVRQPDGKLLTGGAV